MTKNLEMEMKSGVLFLWLDNNYIAVDAANTARLMDFLLEQGVKPDDHVVMNKADYQRLRVAVADLHHSLTD